MSRGRGIVWNKVTFYSKLAAIVVFVATFWIGFWIGLQYQYAVDQTGVNPLHAKIASPVPMRCGGFIQNAPQCPTGYSCVLGKIADLGGTCVKK